MTPEEFFAAEARRPFLWGVTDCAKTANRWCMARAGRSPIRISAQDYHDETGAIDLMAELALPIRVGRAMRAAGFKRTADPKPGDLGILRSADRYACAIRGESMWFFRDERGVAGVPASARLIAAWRVE